VTNMGDAPASMIWVKFYWDSWSPFISLDCSSRSVLSLLSIKPDTITH
jgi:hypothetical protein